MKMNASFDSHKTIVLRALRFKGEMKDSSQLKKYPADEPETKSRVFMQTPLPSWNHSTVPHPNNNMSTDTIAVS